MGFSVGDTAAPSLAANHRIHLLGQCTDLDLLSWVLSIAKHASIGTPLGPLRTQPDTLGTDTYTFRNHSPSLTRCNPSHSKIHRPNILCHTRADGPPTSMDTDVYS
jgi:hypothetical protein